MLIANELITVTLVFIFQYLSEKILNITGIKYLSDQWVLFKIIAAVHDTLFCEVRSTSNKLIANLSILISAFD